MREARIPAHGSDCKQRYLRAVDELAERIRAARMEKGMSQESVAHLAGLSVFAYVNLERGTASHRTPNPTLRTVLQVLWALDLNCPPEG